MIRLIVGKTLETLSLKAAEKRAYSACAMGWECVIVRTQSETTYHLFEAET
jgi:hypothetical protein